MLRSTVLLPSNNDDATVSRDETEHRIEPYLISINEDRRSTAKKSVRFDAMSNVCRLAGPCASDMSTADKRDTWYGPTDYLRFKLLAAKHAGMNIARHNDNHRFVVTGCLNNGDGGGEGKTGVGDTHSACGRGLGYHFSRRRKEARAVARVAVVTWQRKLCGAAAGGAHRGALTLAYAYEQLSCRARGEALWRGEADVGAAYPERRKAHLPLPPAVTTPTWPVTWARTKNGGAAVEKKRSRPDVDDVRKRQRIDGRGWEGERSPGNRGYASEVAQTEI
jgi:hypothetical protein